MGKLRVGMPSEVAPNTSVASDRGRSSGPRYQQVENLTMTPPSNRLLHHGSLSSADSSILYNSHPTSPLLQRSPLRSRPRHTSVNRHGVVVALEDDDDLLQPVYQEPYNNPNMQRGALVLQEKSLATSSATAATSAEHEPIENIEDKELHFVKKGSVLDNGTSYTSGRHASLMHHATGGRNMHMPASAGAATVSEATQLREGLLTGTLTGVNKLNYLDSGYSEEGDVDQQVTSCLMKTSSGSIYIPPNKPKNPTMDSRQEYRFGHSSSSPSHSPTKESLKNSERSTLQYTTSDTPFLPMRNNLASSVDHQKNHRHFMEKNMSKCSWRCIAIFFVVLAVILSAALAYITASSFLPVSYQSAKACAVVVENNSEQKSSAAIAAAKENSPSLLNSAASISYENNNVIDKPRNLPPDGTTFNQIELGPKNRLSQSIPAYGYWNVQFYQMEAAYVHFDLWLPRGASLGFYARRNALPTHTNYDLMEVIKGTTTSNSERNARSIQRSVEKRLSLFMREGHWFVSLYNDFGDAQTVDFVAALSLEMTEGCPNGCNGHGECVLGRCQCHSGYGGDDCSQGACPMLCGGHGEYQNGECQCHPGWKGKECSLRHDECEIADCSGRGRCIEGQCQCIKGYTGEFCQKVDCPDPTCSDHGFCVDGGCICKKGWKGTDCGILDEEARQCLPDCSGQGIFDLESQTCQCNQGFVGDDCSSRLCSLDCGPHGRCEDSSCVCEAGWRGSRCGEKDCDSRCSFHGQCKNGTCLCVAGWNGLHCTLEGCPNGCSNHGSCKANFRGEWSCHCHPGWEGPDCSVRLETRCDDGYDDDQDGLIDCQDPECCESSVCKSSQLCATVARPIDILLQRQPPASTASFFQKMRFIIEEGSLQRYAKNTAFNESRAAVLRGRVVTSSGRGLVGVRVTHADIHTEGYTMTQEDGWFDFMVNGGGAVTLTFGKSPFPAQVRTLFVPWNEVLVIDPVIMSMNYQVPNTTSVTCDAHDYEAMKPIMVASWRLGSPSSTKSLAAGIITETRVLQEVLDVPNTNVKMVYHSGRARGYLSTIELRLTPETIPTSLKAIHLRITIEGVLFEKTFEADPNLKYTYSWTRLNIYRQRVYGTTTAVVKVGYEYEDCSETIWDVQTTKITGQDLTVSDVGGWDVNIHHRYNPQEGILYKGDGSNVFLRERPRLIFNLMGDGSQRDLECDQCDIGSSPALEQKLLSPVAVVSGADGSVYVGDYNLIRRIMPDGTVRTLFKLKSSGVAYRYHMTLNPHDDTLYISDPESHQVIKLLNMENPSDIESNFEPVIGSGIRCLPGDQDHCGDGSHALQARLTYPKGIAISSDNRIYLADGTNIRVVDEDGVISTLIGSNKGRSWKPIGCHGTSRIEDVNLRWPSDLAIHPLDNSVHFIDDNTVLKITLDQQVEIVAGRPLHCHNVDDRDLASFAAKSSLISPTSLDFFGNGDLYLAESDGRRINRISKISTDGRISFFAGKDSKCNCQDSQCPCFDDSLLLASESIFGSISSLAVNPDGSIIVADQLNRRLRRIVSSIPELIQKSQEYEVYNPETQELFVFNRFGLHMETRNIPSNKILYKFSYSVSTSNGKLVGITDDLGNKLKIVRDYAGQASAIENPMRQKFDLKLDRKRMLIRFENPSDNSSIGFAYTRSSELIRSRILNDKSSFVYDYDANGRIERIVLPTGDLLDLTSDLDYRGLLVNVTLNGNQNIQSIRIRPGTVQDLIEGLEIDVGADGRGFIKNLGFQQSFTLKTRPYHLLQDSQGLAESFPIPSSERSDIGKDTVSALEWQYFHTKQRSGKRLKINGETMMTVELNKMTDSQILMLESTQAMLNVSGSRISMMPSGLFSSVIMERTGLGLPKLWKWGDLQTSYAYDRFNRLESLTQGTESSTLFSYKGESFLPEKVTIPSGGSFVFSRDDKGGLEYIMTPRGHTHALTSQLSMSMRKFSYLAPWSRQPYELHYDFAGKCISQTLPEQSGKIIYNYDANQRLESVFGDSKAIEYTFYPDSNLIQKVQVSEEDTGFAVNTNMVYHYGLLKEVTTNFKPTNDLIVDKLNVKYTYDGSARIGGIITQIGKHEPHAITYKYNTRTGRLEGLKDLRMRYESLRKTVIQDLSKSFSLTRDLDSYGRLEETIIRINGYEQFRLKLEYLTDLDLISARSISLARGSPTSEAYEYSPDLSLETVKSEVGQDYHYAFDVNGNVVSVRKAEKETNFVLDGGDRIAMVNGKDYVSYDERGYVVKRGETRYHYNVFGQMVSAYEPNRFSVTFYYDDIGRIIAKRDHRNNVVQFVYANPYNNASVTHIHYPKAAKTYHMIYEEESGHLIAMDTPESRYYIGTDQLGSPIAVFDSKGRLVKEVVRSPYGQVIRDTNPSMDLCIDFAGGLIDQYTHLVHIEGRVYDPVLGQWMTPDWTKVARPGSMKSPYDVFNYRFFNNDPINLNRQSDLMTNMNQWLQIFGLDINKVIGSTYTSKSRHLPVQPTIGPQFSMSVGLLNQQKESESSLKEPNLLNTGSLSLTPQVLTHDYNTHLSTRSSSFGQGMLLSDVNGQAVVTIVSSGDVIQSVLASILNASTVLESSKGGSEEFYFLKEFGFSSDLNELQRLSGTYNISTEAGIRNNPEAKVLCAQNRASTLCILYNIEKRVANRWAMKKAFKNAVNIAWNKEVKAVRNGLNGLNHEWTPNQKAELTSIGEVRGYVATELQNVHRYPGLFGQSSNIRFILESEARQLRNNRGRH